ncbi:MAG TPA: amidohydrolase family protein, partial [Gemmatimonadaceae bacterium]|nr:amidohydrolase family protein [Gemmatimonadaceae bacterium]
IVVQGGRIVSVASGAQVPADARVIDLGALSVMPGLIDAHTHLLQNYRGELGGDDPNMLLTVATMSTAKRALLGVKMGREDLEAGITTVRDVGNSGVSGDVALRDAINAGWVVGPRIRASTRAISAAGGQFGPVQPETQKLIEQEYAVVSTVDEARRAVRQAFYDGADLIKVIVNTGPRVVSLDEMKAIVEEARRVNRTVAAHAIGDTATRIAAEAGVTSIEHAYTVPDEVLRMMAQKGIYLVATDYPAEFYVSALGPSNLTPEQQKQQLAGAAQFAKGNAERLMRAVKAGVKVAFGSDEYYDTPGRTRGQASLLTLQAYQEAGMSPLEVLRTATVNAAALLGWGDRIGAIEAGKLADIIAVDGDPLKDVKELQKVRFVMKGGEIIKGPQR